MITRKIRFAGMACAVVAAVSTRTAAGRSPADWERQASQWAIKTYRSALARKADEAAKIREALDAEAANTYAALPEALAIAGADQGLVVFARPYQDPIHRKAAPTVAEAAVSKLDVSLARDEWQPVQLGVWALKRLNGLSCAVSDLVHAGGKHKIASASHVRCYFVKNVWAPRKNEIPERLRPARPDGDIEAGQPYVYVPEFGEYPGVLLDLPSIDVGANEAMGIWLDVYAPPNAAAGVYRSQVTLAVGGKTVAKMPLHVEIHPFLLDPADQWSRGPFTGKLRTRDELIQMREHGINNMSWWTSGGYTLELKDGRIVADFSPYQKYLKLLDECGYVGPHAVFLGGSDPKIQNRIMEILGRSEVTDARNRKSGPAFAAADLSPPFGDYLCQAMRQFHEQMEAVGHGDLAACLLDEPDHQPRPQRRDYYNAMFDMVEKGTPEVPLYGTFYHAGDEDRLSHHHRIWCTNRPQARIARMCHGAGQKLFTYGFNTRYWERPDLVRFRVGILPWAFTADGTYFWAAYWHKGDPMDPFGLTNTDTFSIPTPHGPLASPMLKGVREAIDDRRYLTTLEKLIATAQQSGSAQAKAEAAKALAFLDSFRTPLFEKVGVRGGRPDFEHSNDEKQSLGRLEVQGLDGAKGVLDIDESLTWAFCDFVRADVVKRIVALQQSLQ